MNIYLCIFFLVILKEILVLLLRFFQEKRKKKENNFSLQTEALCYSSVSVRHSGRRETYWFALKNKIRKGRNRTGMFQHSTCHFDEFTSQLKAQERSSRSWLVAFQNGSESGQIKQPQSGFTGWRLKFFAFPENGSSPESNQGLRGCCSLCELKRRWREKSRNQLLQKARIQTDCFFFFNSTALTQSMSMWSRLLLKQHIFLSV